MKQTIATALASDTPLLIWGAPGSGKTAMIAALAKEHHAHLETVIASAWDAGEILGYLIQHEGRLVHAPAPWISRILTALADNRPTWLFLDEISTAPPSVQAVLLRVVHERVAHALSLQGIRILAAANPSDTAAAEGWLSPASANRWCHVTYTPDAASWVRGEASGWGDGGTRASAFVASWIHHRPQALLALPEREADRERGWPSPRSNSALSRCLHHLSADPVKALLSPTGQQLASGLIGSPTTVEMTTWATALDLPDPESVLAGAKLPTRGDQLSATLLAVVSAATSEHPDRAKRIAKTWSILAKVRRDIAVTPAAALLEIDGDVPDEARDLGQTILSAKATLSK